MSKFKRWYLAKSADFLRFWMSQFEGHSTRCSQLTVKTMLARLRKLQSWLSLIFRAAVTAREDEGDREGIPHTHPIP